MRPSRELYARKGLIYSQNTAHNNDSRPLLLCDSKGLSLCTNDHTCFRSSRFRIVNIEDVTPMDLSTARRANDGNVAVSSAMRQETGSEPNVTWFII